MYSRNSARFVRYAAALIILVYGFAKINGSQFTILDSELDKPMGHVSGFWLTWYYFGYSPVYKMFLGLAEIGGALLLTFRRTALAGAFVLAAVMANVVLVDFCFGVDPGAAVIAMLLLAAMIWLISLEWERLRPLFWPSAEGATPVPGGILKWSVRFAMVALAFAFTYWTANYNNRLPTPLDGAWEVVQVDPPTSAAQFPRKVFFEYNRAYMAVFKAGDGTYATHHFEIDDKAKTIRMWKNWLTKGDLIFSGKYALAEAELSIDGTLSGVGHAVLRLHRQSVR